MKTVTMVDLRRGLRTGEPIGPRSRGGSLSRVKASLLREAVLEGLAGEHLWMKSVQIEGPLNLHSCEGKSRLRFENCRFEYLIDMRQAELADVVFQECAFGKGLIASQLTVHWNLSFAASISQERIQLDRARVGGDLSFENGLLSAGRLSANPVALHLDGVTVQGSVHLRRLDCKGVIAMMGAKVDAQLNLTEARVYRDVGIGPVLLAEGLEVGNGVFCGSFEAVGEVRFSSSKIGGQFFLGRARFRSYADGDVPGLALVASGITVGGHMLAREVSVTGGIYLMGATVGGQLSLSGTLEASSADAVAVNADQLDVSGSVFLQNLRAYGEIRLLEAKVGGQLSLKDSKVSVREIAEQVKAISLDGIQVADTLHMDGVMVEGELRLPGAKVGGTIFAVAANLRVAGGVTCLEGQGCEVIGGIYAPSIMAIGEVDFSGAHLGSKVSLTYSTIESVAGPAIRADRCEIEGGLDLQGTQSIGEVRFLGARIGSQLSLIEARLFTRRGGVPEEVSLAADRTEVAGGMFCEGLRAQGEVRLPGVCIKGQLSLAESRLEGRPEQVETPFALSLEGADIAADLVFEGMHSIGELRLVEAKVGGQLSLKNAVLEPQPGMHNTFFGDGIQVEGGVVCHKMKCRGEFRLYTAEIKDHLAMIGVQLDQGEADTALGLNDAELEDFILAPIHIRGSVDLRYASARTFWDANQGDFVGGPPESVWLDGFKYQSLREPLSAEQRQRWIDCSETDRYIPGIYVELATAYKRGGHIADARKILIAGERRSRKQFGRLSIRGIWHDFLWVTVGYGYRNGLAAIWLIGLICVGAVAFEMGESSFNEVARGSATDLNPTLYAIDVTVPILDLNQQASYAPSGLTAWISLFLSVAGYGLATAVIAAAAGLLNRDQLR